MTISMSVLNGSSVIRLLLDTQILIWLPAADKRLKRPIVEIILDGETDLFVSAVTAWEYSDLRKRKRVSAPDAISDLQRELGFTLLDLPAGVWADIENLPEIHTDPTDRMLISHCRLAELTLVTSDSKIREYPVETLW
jgi:PIN domain nuclease of toxin-antitoxin system